MTIHDSAPANRAGFPRLVSVSFRNGDIGFRPRQPRRRVLQALSLLVGSVIMTARAISAPRILYCPYGPVIHPSFAQVNAGAIAWLDKFCLYSNTGQRERLVNVEAGVLSARTSPSASVEALQLGADFQMWLFAFDDAHCDEGDRDLAQLVGEIVALQRVLEAPSLAPGDPYAAGLRDIRLRMARIASPLQLNRWIGATSLYLASQAWDTRRAPHRESTVNDYLSHRLHNGAVLACIAMLDIANGHELQPSQLELPAVRALTEMCSCVVGLDNDIASRSKEIARSAECVNAVDIAMRELGCTLDEALATVVELRDRITLRFANLADHVLTYGAEPISAYVADLKSWIRGNLDWSAHCTRYTNYSHEVLILVDDWSSADRAVPILDVPAVRWWWAIDLGTEAEGASQSQPQLLVSSL